LIPKGENYVYGATAEKLKYDVYEQNKVLKEKKRQKRNAKAKIKAVCLLLCIFGACFLVIYRYALITEMNYKLDKSIKSYNSIRDENAQLRVEIDRATDLNRIKEIAQQKLGMQRPDKYQIVYVNVPKNDYTEVVTEVKKEERPAGNVFAILFDKVGKLTRLAY